MKVAFPTSIPTIPKVESTSVFAGFDSLLGNIEYTLALHDKLRSGSRIVQFGGGYSGLQADTIIALSFDELDRVVLRQTHYQACGVLVFPDNPLEYEKAAAMDSVSVIAVGTITGFDRIEFLVNLGRNGNLCQKPHWLYGVPNPAELAIYGKLLANFVSGRIELAVCSTCFLYSVFGIPFSSDTGVIYRLGELQDTRVTDLGMAGWDNYEMSREQMRCFHMNTDMVHAFASGMVADSYMNRVGCMLEEAVV